MEGRLRDIETEMRGMRQEMSGRLRDSENAIKYHVSDKHETLAQNVQAQTKSGHARLIWVVIGSQVVLVGGFVYYKRRKTSPKKYL
jgi:mannose-binding lectin 1